MCFSLLHQRLLCSQYSALLHPNIREASGHMKDVEGCLALDEAIGQSSQGYQKWGHAARASWVLKIGLVAPSGISASSDSRTKFLWQTEPRRCLMWPLKPKI